MGLFYWGYLVFFFFFEKRVFGILSLESLENVFYFLNTKYLGRYLIMSNG